MNRRKRTGGFTLLEVTVALTVMGVAMLGALMGMTAATKNVGEGQLRQYAAALAESYAQGVLLKDRRLIAQAAVDLTTSPDLEAIGAAPWKIDPQGLFEVHEDGVVTPVNLQAASCADAAIPAGTFCRETVVLNGVPFTGANAVSGIGRTVWVRVSRAGDPAHRAVVQREVVVQ